MRKYLFDSPIGRILVEIEDKSLVGVELGGRTKRFDESNHGNKVISQLGEYFAGKRKEFSVEFMLGGTEFQEKVWEEISKIPFGETVSYKELSWRVGRSKAYRAVANACGANPVPIVVPCHRVVGSTSTSLRVNSFVNNLGGYSSGIEKKKWLLKHEGVDL